jgi:hypothetical protein
VTISGRAARIGGWALIAYGLAGILLLLIAFAVASGPLGTAQRLLVSLDGTLHAAADTARRTSTALDSVDSGLGEAQRGTADASTLVADAAATSGRLASAMGLTIFGAQPLIGLSDDFEAIQTQLTGLSANLDAVSGAMATSSDDLDDVRIDVARLATEIERVRDTTGTDAGGTGSIGLAVGVLLAWLALPAIAALIGGAALLRIGRRLGLEALATESAATEAAANEVSRPDA